MHTGVKLNTQGVFFSYKFTRRDICATDQLCNRWRFAQNDARHHLSAASVHRHHKLITPAAAFMIPYFCSQSGSDLCCWVAKSLVKWTQVSRFRRLIVSHAQWAGTLPCWKKNSPKISRMTAWQAVAIESESPHGSMRHWSSL